MQDAVDMSPVMRTVFPIVVTVLLVLGGESFADSRASPLVLITEQEAKLPPATRSSATARAGITRAPKIVLLAPAGGLSDTTPLHLQFRFDAFGGARIDPASVRITYLKQPTIDLTDRLKGSISTSGIDVAAVELPSGIHDIRVDLKDNGGRMGTANFTLRVGH
jgi:hypothetical protein